MKKAEEADTANNEESEENQEDIVKNIPQRTCSVCRTQKNKNELLRIVRNKENIIKNTYLFAQQLYIRNPYIIMFHSNRINR